MTDGGPPLTREQMRAFDRRAIEEWGVPGVVLMENAGRGTADLIERELGGAAGRAVAIVAGAGNNGGDGFVVARHLYVRDGRPTVYLVAPGEKLDGDAAVNFAILDELGFPVVACAEDLGRREQPLAAADLIVDAVGGTGISGALRGTAAEAVERINAVASSERSPGGGRPVVAIDIPTGLDCDTGEAPGPTVRATVTVTMAARKAGFDNPAATEFTGRVVVVDIGVPCPGRAAGGPERP
jgi:NAD(P)H-hydrate epimerase